MRHSMMIGPMLAIAFAVPAFAQQTNMADQQMRRQVEAIVKQYVDTLNRGDEQAYAALFAPNAITITPFGKDKKTSEPDQSAQFRESVVEKVHSMGLALTAEVDDVEPIFGGQGAMATASYTGTFTNTPATPQVRGNMLFVLEHAGDSWKIRVQTASRLAPAAPAR